MTEQHDPEDPTVRDDESAIRHVLSQYAAALNASDTAAALACYADEGMFMAPGFPTAHGTAALRATYDTIFQTIALQVSFDIDEVVVAAADIGYALTRSHGLQTTLQSQRVDEESNREVFIFENTAAGWRIARYLFNQPS